MAGFNLKKSRIRKCYCDNDYNNYFKRFKELTDKLILNSNKKALYSQNVKLVAALNRLWLIYFYFINENWKTKNSTSVTNHENTIILRSGLYSENGKIQGFNPSLGNNEIYYLIVKQTDTFLNKVKILKQN